MKLEDLRMEFEKRLKMKEREVHLSKLDLISEKKSTEESRRKLERDLEKAHKLIDELLDKLDEKKIVSNASEQKLLSAERQKSICENAGIPNFFFNENNIEMTILSEREEEDLIKSRDYNPAKVNKKVLFDDHRIAHAWWSQLMRGKKLQGWTKEAVRDIHDRIAKEIEKRGFKHNSPLSESLSKKLGFVFQHHFRGKSVHGDLRFERNGFLEGFTLDDMVEKEIEEPVDSVEEGIRQQKTSKWKIDLKTGETITDPRTGQPMKILAQHKAKQPKVWLRLRGVVKRGGIGATKNYAGVFVILDEGWYEPGMRKPFFWEYFIHGKRLRGRYVVRKIPTAGLVPKEKKERFKTPFALFFWKPKNQTPYILTARAERKKDLPPRGESALPKEWEEKIPESLRWWEKRLTGQKAWELIRKARRFIQTGRKPPENEYLEKTRFVLQRHWWKGQRVIRDMPVEHWDIRFGKGKPYFNLDKNPVIQEANINAVRKVLTDERWMTFEGDILPEGKEKREWLRPGNPNKRIPAHVEIIDRGIAEIVNNTSSFFSVKLNGRYMKGYWIFKNKNGIWLMEKSQLPRTQGRPLARFDLPNEKIKEIITLSLDGKTRSEIAEAVGCSKKTVFNHQKIAGLI
jgi:hypothetical protein